MEILGIPNNSQMQILPLRPPFLDFVIASGGCGAAPRWWTDWRTRHSACSSYTIGYNTQVPASIYKTNWQPLACTMQRLTRETQIMRGLLLLLLHLTLALVPGIQLGNVVTSTEWDWHGLSNLMGSVPPLRSTPRAQYLPCHCFVAAPMCLLGIWAFLSLVMSLDSRIYIL